MSAKQIIFTGPMIHALLGGRKTQTRRTIKPQPSFYIRSYPARLAELMRSCPYGRPGNLLWVRENWQYAGWSEDGDPLIRYAADDAERWCRANTLEWGEKLIDIWASLSDPENMEIDGHAADRRWRASIHMPRWASRLTLRLTDVRVQRLQEISESDALAEGASAVSFPIVNDQHSDIDRFRTLWNSINGPSAWERDEWVWALSFEAIQANVDQVREAEV